MDEVMPGEVVEMTITTGQEETRGYGIGVLRRLIALRASTSLVNEARAFGPESVLLYFEQPRIEGGQQAAFYTTHPTRKRSHWNTYVRLGRPDVDELALLEWRHPKVLHLHSQHLPDGSQ
jgi:hypothetical protein